MPGSAWIQRVAETPWRALLVWLVRPADANTLLVVVLAASSPNGWRNSLNRIGKDAPLERAHDVVGSNAFGRKWANKMPFLPPEYDFTTTPPRLVGQGGVAAVHEFLDLAETEA